MDVKLINEKLKELEAKNDKFNMQTSVLQEEVKERQQKFQIIREEQVRLQGEHRALTALLPKETEKKSK